MQDTGSGASELTLGALESIGADLCGLPERQQIADIHMNLSSLHRKIRARARAASGYYHVFILFILQDPCRNTPLQVPCHEICPLQEPCHARAAR